MRRKLHTICVALAALLWTSALPAQPTVKIGLILSYSGQFADIATQIDNGVKLYVKQHGDIVVGKKIEIVRKDVGGGCSRRSEAISAGVSRSRSGGHHHGLRADAKCTGRSGRFSRSKEIHGGDERGNRNNHNQVAVHGARVCHVATELRTSGNLGSRKRGEEAIYNGLGLWSRP